MTLTTAGSSSAITGYKGLKLYLVPGGERIDGLPEYAGYWKYRWRYHPRARQKGNHEIGDLLWDSLGGATPSRSPYLPISVRPSFLL